jgi:hypothetical protein
MAHNLTVTHTINHAFVETTIRIVSGTDLIDLGLEKHSYHFLIGFISGIPTLSREPFPRTKLTHHKAGQACFNDLVTGGDNSSVSPSLAGASRRCVIEVPVKLPVPTNLRADVLLKAILPYFPAGVPPTGPGAKRGG